MAIASDFLSQGKFPRLSGRGGHFRARKIAAASSPASKNRKRRKIATLGALSSQQHAVLGNETSAQNFSDRSFLKPPWGHGRPRLRVMDVRTEMLCFPRISRA